MLAKILSIILIPFFFIGWFWMTYLVISNIFMIWRRLKVVQLKNGLCKDINVKSTLSLFNYRTLICISHLPLHQLKFIYSIGDDRGFEESIIEKDREFFKTYKMKNKKYIGFYKKVGIFLGGSLIGIELVLLFDKLGI